MIDRGVDCHWCYCHWCYRWQTAGITGTLWVRCVCGVFLLSHDAIHPHGRQGCSAFTLKVPTEDELLETLRGLE